MTKLELQKEILEKVKPGMKPSDIKKQVQKEAKTLPSPFPIEIKDDGYESDKSDKSIPIAPPLPNQTLLNQITALKKQLQLYKDFRSSDLRIKEKLQQENKLLKEKVSQLEKPEQNPAETPKETKPEPKPPKLYFFTCDICEQNKKSQLHLGKVNGLGVDPLKENKICDTCIRKVDLIQPPQEDFF